VFLDGSDRWQSVPTYMTNQNRLDQVNDQAFLIFYLLESTIKI